MTELNIGDMRFAKSKRGWYDNLQIWTGTEWRDCDPAIPPPELIEDWIEIAKPEPWKRPPDPNVLCTLAARWGYEQHEKALLGALHSVEPQPHEPDNE